MIRDIRATLGMLLILTVLTGLLYPLIVTGIAQTVFPFQANGSLVTDAAGETRGSELIGQSFTDPSYFWGRLSATGPTPYNASASSGSNYGPLHFDLGKNAQNRIEALRLAGGSLVDIPVDLVTSSGSGLDPHISPAAAEFQVERVALARHLSAETVRALVFESTQGRQFGILGEPRVNVLKLNLALDRMPSKR